MKREALIKSMGIELPKESPSGAIYKPVRQVGRTLFISGQIPVENGQIKYTGKLKDDSDIERGRQAARLCIVNMLAAVKEQIGNLDLVTQVVKIQVFVNSVTGFTFQHLVANGASELLIDVFGKEDGCPARTAVGTNQLPLDVTVEIEGIFEICG